MVITPHFYIDGNTKIATEIQVIECVEAETSVRFTAAFLAVFEMLPVTRPLLPCCSSCLTPGSQMADEGGALAPHGVPASPMPRALSSSRLHEQDPGYGSTNYQAQDGTLAPPGNALLSIEDTRESIAYSACCSALIFYGFSNDTILLIVCCRQPAALSCSCFSYRLPLFSLFHDSIIFMIS